MCAGGRAPREGERVSAVSFACVCVCVRACMCVCARVCERMGWGGGERRGSACVCVCRCVL